MCTSKAAKRAPSSTSRCPRKLTSSLRLGATPRDESRLAAAISILKRDTSTPAHSNAVFRPDSFLTAAGRTRGISLYFQRSTLKVDFGSCCRNSFGETAGSQMESYGETICCRPYERLIIVFFIKFFSKIGTMIHESFTQVYCCISKSLLVLNKMMIKMQFSSIICFHYVYLFYSNVSEAKLEIQDICNLEFG